jgi:type VI secretion system protein ImpI
MDVRDGRVMVRDEGSTNGTYVHGQRLEPNRWVDIGASDEAIALRVVDWDLHLQARRAPTTTTARTATFAPGGATVLDATPFGASASPTAAGSPLAGGFLVSFAGPVDRVSEPAQAARAALEALRGAVKRELTKVPVCDRAALIQRLREHYPEVRTDAVLDAELAQLVPEHVQTTTPAAGAAAFAALQDLSSWYVDGKQPVSSPDDIVAFTERLRMGIDELVGGVVRLVGGVDQYNDKMEIDGAGAPYPREAAAFARAVFEWRDEARDGGQVVRAAVLDVIVQQLGSFQATLRGVRELLTVLDPKTIEAEWRNEARRRGRWGGLVARLLGPVGVLQTYRRQHHNLASEEDGWFRVLFGKRFAAEYRAFAREARASEGAPRLAPRPDPHPVAQLPSAPRAAAVEPLHAAALPGPEELRGGTAAMAPPLTPSAPAVSASEPRGGTVVMAPALKPSGGRPAPGTDSNQ